MDISCSFSIARRHGAISDRPGNDRGAITFNLSKQFVVTVKLAETARELRMPGEIMNYNNLLPARLVSLWLFAITCLTAIGGTIWLAYKF